MNIKDMIYNIKKRPKMYLSDFQLDYIYHYISGVLTCYCSSIEYSEEDINFIFNNQFHNWVSKWIEKNMKVTCSFSFNWLYKINDTLLFAKDNGKFILSVISLSGKIDVVQDRYACNAREIKGNK